MRLAMVTHKVGFQDGQGLVNFEIAQAALERGDHVTIVAEFCSDKLASHPRVRFIRTRERHVPTQMLRNLLFAWTSWRWLRAHRGEFDLIQANGFVTFEPADIVAVHFVHGAWLKTPDFPYRWSSFSPYAYYQRTLTMLNAFFELRAFRSAKRLIAVSAFTRDEVIGRGLAPEKITVAPNGVNTEAFHPGPSERGSFSLPVGVPMALFVGDIRTTRKNLETVLQSMPRLPELHLAVAGKTDGSPYPAMANAMGIADRVHFVGKTSRIPALMRSADLFVFPSRYEAHPLVLLEALASGLPVVVASNFGAANYIRKGGIVFGDAADVDALTAVLKELMGSPARLAALSTGAREEALGMQWLDTVKGYLRVYDELLKR